jgi:hypothetical protein
MSSTNDEQPKALYGVRDPVAGHPHEREAFAGARAPAAQATPITYRAFPSLLSEQVKAPTPELRKIAAGETERRAVWIVHGMGQQIPFETLDSLTQGILRVAKPPAGAAAIQASACSIRVGDQVLQRVELKVQSHGKAKEIELHLYEAYWAPLTEGVANLRDVTGFLVNGALRGILNSLKTFKRALFGEICDFKIRKRVPLYILAVLVLLGSLTVINAVIVAATVNKVRVLGVQFDPLTQGWPVLTAIASAVSALAITLGAILFLAESCKSGVATEFRRNMLSWISWLGTVVTSTGIVAAAVLSVLTVWPKPAPAWRLKLQTEQLQFFSTTIILVVLALIGLAMMTRAKKRSQAAQTAKNGFLFTLLVFAQLLHIAAIVGLAVSCFGLHYMWPHFLDWAAGIRDPLSSPWWVWPFLVFLSAQIRTLMVEYVGDVVIYVTSNKIDRFSEVRQKIKDVAYKSASAVFHAMTEDGKHFEYEKVAIIGHSLGSAIAYDTLNRLINEDRMTDGKMRIAHRTCLLETFGSPLNKLAFFFTIQGSDSFQIREQLAESVQPLIMNYEYRPYPWVNVRSPNDIISGEVYLYDWPPPNSSVAKAPMKASIPAGYVPAIDEIDPDASVALAAHVDYWKNQRVWERLYEQVTA